ncbi:SGNH/GDSL hydrolase family protein [Clostridium sp. OS1-26]|uniref:SGNH/GDSL hydrolase family protein n=1 Tax=Clostridium sp. OS1-26 TaxID=3070681 RepID=UPI0027E18C6B|nr:SGNH/GDSL hydrolase family protein [Clostridium sp. OS1-26]WML35465.1 SGNH/GDSL hydrolase family protein [Clostridium sp. OS1-26]
MNNKFNIVFLGGSITEGTGASIYENSYTYKVGEYLKVLYKDKNVDIINSGVSGTGSNFGVFRLKTDVIAKDPDLVFIEFAVNDRIENSYNAAVTMEGILKQLSKLKSKPAVVILITPTGLADACSSVHKRVAYYYGVPVIDIQDYMYRHIGVDDYTWQDISIDNLHPNDKGHSIYAECIINSIKDLDILNRKPIEKINTITGYEFNNPNIISYEKATFYGHWREENINIPQIEIAAVSDTIGDCLEFNFNGKCIAITTLLSEESGCMEIKIDGINYFLDLYTNLPLYFSSAINLFNLSEGNHDIIIRVSDRKNLSSKGNKITIGSFLVDMSY